MPRRRQNGLLLALVLAASPTVAYEALEKHAERVGPRDPWLALTLRAEFGTRWQPATGVLFVDRALHEVAEANRFWHLAGRRALRLASASGVGGL